MNWNIRIALGLLAFLALIFVLLWAAGLSTRAGNGGADGIVPPSASGNGGGEEQTDFQLTLEDNGERFVYPVASRFTVVLPENLYPQGQLRCEPGEIIRTVTGIPEAPTGFYATRFETVRPGVCLLKSGGWEARIRVMAEEE